MAVQGLGALGALSATAARPAVKGGSTQEVMGSFADALNRAISNVDGMQMRADDLIQKLQTGEVQDVHEVMAAVEEAGLAMQLALQLRSKAIDAYQEIMRMQV